MPMVRFGDVAERVNTKEDRFNTDLVYYVGGDHIETNELKVSGRGIIKEADLGPMFYFGFKPGDILFVTRNPHLRKSAKVDFAGICSEKTLVIATKDENVLLQDYLAGVMQSDDFWDFMEENKSGSVNYFINWSTLADYEFDLPPIEKQRELAELLWAANDLKESYKKLIVATDEMLKAKFREMFGECGVQSEYSAEKRSNGEVVKIGDVFETCSGGTPLTKRREYYDGGTIPWMSSGEVAQGIITEVTGRITELGLKNSAAKLVPANAVVVAMYGATAGKVGMLKVETSTNQAVCAILPSEKVVPGYLYFCLKNKQDYMVANAKGGAQPNISQAFIRNIQIPLPPLSLQQEFVEIARKADETKAALKKSIADVESVIKGLING